MGMKIFWDMSDGEKSSFTSGLAVGCLIGIAVGWNMHRLRRTYLDKKKEFFEKQLKKVENQIRKDNIVDTTGSVKNIS